MSLRGSVGSIVSSSVFSIVSSSGPIVLSGRNEEKATFLCTNGVERILGGGWIFTTVVFSDVGTKFIVVKEVSWNPTASQ